MTDDMHNTATDQDNELEQMAQLIAAGWQHDGQGNWLYPGDENPTPMSLAEAGFFLSITFLPQL